MTRLAVFLAFIGLLASTTAFAQSSKRTELAKGDLTGKDMDIIVPLKSHPEHPV